MDLVGLIADGVKWLLGGWREQRIVDRWMADHAKRLRRQLNASFEDWPTGPQTLHDHVRWASRLLQGFPATGPAMDEMVDRRGQASGQVERAIGVARDDYTKAADLVTGLFKGGLTVSQDNRSQVDEKLRVAATHVHRCMITLSSVEADQRE